MKYNKASDSQSASRDADPDTSLATAAESGCWGRATAVDADGNVIGGLGVGIAAWTSGGACGRGNVGIGCCLVDTVVGDFVAGTGVGRMRSALKAWRPRLLASLSKHPAPPSS